MITPAKSGRALIPARGSLALLFFLSNSGYITDQSYRLQRINHGVHIGVVTVAP